MRTSTIAFCFPWVSNSRCITTAKMYMESLILDESLFLPLCWFSSRWPHHTILRISVEAAICNLKVCSWPLDSPKLSTDKFLNANIYYLVLIDHLLTKICMQEVKYCVFVSVLWPWKYFFVFLQCLSFDSSDYTCTPLLPYYPELNGLG